MDKETGLRERLLSVFNKNFMVEAGAGAGKTTLIIDRILNQITRHGNDGEPMKLEEIAAITFTEKAANELKIRVSQGLEKRYQETEDEAVRELLTKARLSIDDQFVGTIHSFCQEILRKNAFEAGLGLDYKVLDPEEDQQIRELVWQMYIIREEKDLVPLMKRLDQLELSLADAKSAFDFITGHENSVIDYDVRAYMNEPPLSELAECLEPLLHFFREGTDGELETRYGEPLNKPLNAAERAAFESYFRQRTDKGCISLAKVLIDKHDKDGFICSKPYYNKSPYAQELLASINLDRVKSVYDEYYIYKYDVSMSIAYPALGEYTKYKRRIMAVNFDDLLVLSRNLMRDSLEARNRVRKRYKCLYIDEYQDTDSIQSEIIFYLNGDAAGHSVMWYDRRLIPGSTFIVGDPKQSIYRFRGADITQYNMVKDIFQRDPYSEIIILKRNYRTQSGIIDWVERAFMLPGNCSDELQESGNGSSKFLMNHIAPYQASFFGMTAQRIDIESEDPKVVKGVYTFLAEDRKKIDDYRASEAIWVAGYIDRLVREGFLLETYDTATGCVERRPISHKDFLILLYYTKGMGDYITALKQKNIPVSYAGKLKLGDIDEIANYIDLVQYLAQPRNESLLCSILINCFGIRGLQQWKRVEENGSLRTVDLVDYLEDEDLDNRTEPLFKALYRIKVLLNLKEMMTPIAFMKRLLDEFEILYTNKYNETLIKSIAGTLHYLIEKLSAKSLTSFEIAARELSIMKELDTDREMLLEDAGNNGSTGVVRIMNLHKAKGLEAPIVILATGGSDFNHKPTKATRQTDKGREVYIKLSRGNSIIGYCRGWNSVEAAEEISLKAESLRLHYVAATRPINALVISGWRNNSWKRHKELPSKEIETVFPAAYLERGSLHEINKGLVQERKMMIELRREELLDNASKPRYKELSPSKLEDKSNLERSSSKEIQYFGPSGELWGTVVHRIFQLYLYRCGNKLKKLPGKDIIDGIIDRAVDEVKNEVDYSEYKDQLYKTLNNFTNNPDVVRLTEAARILPELRFDIKREGDGVPEYVSGIIDFLISTNEGVYLMDYKTNIPRGTRDEFINQIKDTYRPQLGMYREFLENTMGKTVIGTYLYLTALDKVVEI